MSIYLNKDSKVIVQGITGGEGTKHTALMLKAGTQVVGGVNARKAGTTVSHKDADGNDVSEREWQMNRGPTWTKGKSAPTFGPLGPWLVTLDEIPDLKNLAMSLDVNGEPA